MARTRITTSRDPMIQALRRLQEQQRWMDQHGGTSRAGYVAFYCEEGDGDTTREQALAIFEADFAELLRCRAEVEDLRGWA